MGVVRSLGMPATLQMVLIADHWQVFAYLGACGSLPAETITHQNASEPEESGGASKTIRDGCGAKDTLQPK